MAYLGNMRMLFLTTQETFYSRRFGDETIQRNAKLYTQ